MWGRQEDNVWYDGAILEWQGRQLQSFQAFSEYDGTNMDDEYAVYFKYNSDGIRTEKITDAGNLKYLNRISKHWTHHSGFPKMMCPIFNRELLFGIKS